KEKMALDGTVSEVLCVAVSPDGTLVAAGSVDNSLMIWNIATGEERVARWSDVGDRVRGLAFSPDGKTMATAAMAYLGKIWDVPQLLQSGVELAPASSAQKEARAALIGHSSYVTAVVFTPDDKILASASHDKTAKLWELATGREITTLMGHHAAIVSLALSPD